MKVLSIAQAAELLPLSESALYKLAQRGEAPFTKPGGKWMALEEDLIEWIRAGPKGRGRSQLSADPMPTPAGSRFRERVKANAARRRME